MRPQRTDERIPILLDTPAAVRGVSAEPLLGPVSVERWLPDLSTLAEVDLPRLDWVIAGCESGPGARPMDEAWAVSLRDQCAVAGVPFFYKQAMRGGRLDKLPHIDGREYAEFPRG